MFAIGEYVARARDFLRSHTVDVGCIGDFDDLVAFHHVAADAGDAAVGLVVHEYIAAVIGAVRERHMRMVQIAVHEGSAAIGEELAGLRPQAFGEDLEALIGQTPPGRAAAIEHRNAHELSHRGEPEDAHLACLAAAVKGVIFVEVARLHLGAVGGRPCLRLGGGHKLGGGHAANRAHNAGCPGNRRGS